MLVIVGAVIVAVALAVGAYFLFFSKDNPISSVVGNLTGNSEVVDRSDGKLDLSNLIDPQDIIKEQDIKAKVNQQVNLSDGLSYMVTGVERNFVSTSRFLKAGTGKELVKVNFVIGNRDKTGETYISSGDFNIKNSAGGMQDAKYTTTDDFADSLEPQELASGKQIKGSLIYEVDKGEQISVVTEQKYEKLGGDKKEVTLKSQVTL